MSRTIRRAPMGIDFRSCQSITQVRMARFCSVATPGSIASSSTRQASKSMSSDSANRLVFPGRSRR
jgi:hypothetical protein